MGLKARYRALSLDFWFTAIYHDPGLDATWETDRVRVLTGLLVPSGGGTYTVSEMEAAIIRAQAELGDPDRSGVGDVGRRALLLACARVLDARFTTSPERAVEAYSAAGLVDHPPRINPELARVASVLESMGVPVVAITNTGRPESVWRDFFTAQGISPFVHIITSYEVGRGKPDPEMFREAARRLALPPKEILHVGDRWELDVQGALSAGCGAVLYRGLWAAYPPGMYPETDPTVVEGTEVLCIDRLEDLLTGDLWAKA